MKRKGTENEIEKEKLNGKTDFNVAFVVRKHIIIPGVDLKQFQQELVVVVDVCKLVIKLRDLLINV